MHTGYNLWASGGSPLNIELVAITGPLLGERIVIVGHTTTRIGRSPRGVNIPDPLVSLDHAELSYHAVEGDWSIVDLGSAEGTIVDGEKIEKSTPVRPGTVIEIGSSAFVVEDQGGLPRWVLPTFGAVGLSVGAMAVMSLTAQRPVTYDPVLHLTREVHAEGQVLTELVVPESFIRRYGFDHRGLRVNDITDYDGDGVDELWIGEARGELALSVQANGDWRVFGEFPAGCHSEPFVTFPDRVCDGLRYRYDGGQYVLRGLDNAVGWLAPKEATAIGPVRMRLASESALGDFLRRRGVDEPVHYLVCEDFMSGVAAQALTASGRLVPLEPGCIREASLSGPDVTEFSSSRPSAVAFTAVGYEALRADVSAWLGGDPDALFASSADRALRQRLFAPPQERASTLALSFGSSADTTRAPDGARGPMAREEPVSAYRALLPFAGTEPRTLSKVVAITREGTAQLATQGCSKLQVHTEPWHCALHLFCSPSTTFLTLSEVGCPNGGPLASLTYAGGSAIARTADTEVQVIVESQGDASQTDVLRARLVWRSVADGS